MADESDTPESPESLDDVYEWDADAAIEQGNV
jgi:hypothetical protein